MKSSQLTQPKLNGFYLWLLLVLVSLLYLHTKMGIAIPENMGVGQGLLLIAMAIGIPALGLALVMEMALNGDARDAEEEKLRIIAEEAAKFDVTRQAPHSETAIKKP